MKQMSFVLAKDEHAVEVGENLRETDEKELALSAGLPPVDACLKSLKVSTIAWAARRYGKTVAVFGVAPFKKDPKVGVIWLLATDGVERRAFLESARYYIDLMARIYPRMMNAVWVENDRSIRWLERLGFHCAEVIPEYGAGKAPFQLMVFDKDSNNV